jgi:hypothetical protein
VSWLQQCQFTNSQSRVFEKKEIRFIIGKMKRRTRRVSSHVKGSSGAQLQYVTKHMSQNFDSFLPAY